MAERRADLSVLLGLISDTHGRLPIAVLEHFAGVARILHAGDIGSADVLTSLEAVAPVTAVWGNTDGFALRSRLPEKSVIEEAGRRLVLVHGHQLGTPSPRALRTAHPDADIVIFGHTHRPERTWLDGRLFLNPGAAGAPRFNLRPSIGLLRLDAGAEPVIDFIQL